MTMGIHDQFQRELCYWSNEMEKNKKYLFSTEFIGFSIHKSNWLTQCLCIDNCFYNILLYSISYIMLSFVISCSFLLVSVQFLSYTYCSYWNNKSSIKWQIENFVLLFGVWSPFILSYLLIFKVNCHIILDHLNRIPTPQQIDPADRNLFPSGW